ncbi:VOC family protein [Haloactinopolyspora sp.]|uniref:VOC family protein n=1 Tax=Haloactinopolyspora sp. TaxID=1966353 RepID=UPI0026160C85|nr:VOC family protein [Haloactinopolyspora sp.]
MTPPRFAAVGLVVDDMARALAFYRALGLDIPAESDTAPHAEAALPGGLRLMFDTVETVKSFDPDWTRPTGSQMSLAVECESPGAVDQEFARMVDAGYTGHLDPWDAPWGQRYATLLDPDGNGVDLFAALPAT